MYGPTPPVPPSLPPSAPAYAAYPPPAGHPGQPTPYLGYGAHPDHGFAPYPPPPRCGTAARVGLVVLRVVLGLVPIGTIGFLSWVPLLFTAIRQRRAQDWIALGISMVVATTGVVTLGSSNDSDTDVGSNVGMALLVIAAVGSTVWFLVAELRPPAAAEAAPLPPPYAVHWPAPAPTFAAPTAAPTAAPPPLVPLGQVQAELDELSALLRGHDRPAG
ncbi:hypothetical protein ABH931_000503 [Streptacidiphilus sp. MAP12-33]|uniref:hypothetical protein n=1 Tax=Streptacidiphilus sp. MAP12-33 TaxID=3156266 RepID=UPI0035171081